MKEQNLMSNIGEPTADMRQLVYNHIYKLRTFISHSRISSAPGDIDHLLNWCAALYELYTLLIGYVPQEDQDFYEELARIEDEILKTKHEFMREKRSLNEEARKQAYHKFIESYSKLQRQLHERQKSLYLLITQRKMDIPRDDEDEEDKLKQALPQE